MTGARPMAVSRDAAAASIGILRRKCSCGGSSAMEGECESCKQKGASLQRRASGGAPATVPPLVHQVLRSPGRPLDSATRSLMEPLFGHDFGRVRVHADSRAAESARAVNAKAYAVANQIVFNSGEYQPGTAAGLSSLAHELTHVVQQSGGAPGSIPERIHMGAHSDPAEREAEQAGRADWSRAALSVRDQPCLRRQPSNPDQPEKEPPPMIPLPHPFDRLDIKPIVPGPIDSPSLEDVNKGLFKLGGGGEGGQPNLKCPQGWHMRYEGLCCPGTVADPDRCCPPHRMTNLAVCCPTNQFAEGSICKDYPHLTPKDTITPNKGDGTPPPERRTVPKPGRNVLQQPPLTTSLDIYFKQNQPGGVVGEKALRDSLTVSGAATLDGLGTWLKNGPQFAVQLTGKASIEGPASHNRDLGEFRARSVANFLALKGMAGRLADPAGLPAACAKLEDGLHNCADTQSSNALDEKDRQVRATLFIPRQNP